MAYASLIELKRYLGIDTDADDALLEQLLTAAQAMVDAWCRRTFEAGVDAERVYDSETTGDSLMLDADLCVVTAVVENGLALVRGADFLTQPRADAPFYALKRLDGAWSGEIIVTGRWGYSQTAPADVAHATMRLAAYLYRQKDNAAGDLDRTIIAGNTTILPAAFPSDVEKLLRSYRRLTV